MDIQQLMAWRFLQAFGASGGLSVGSGVIGDLYKLEERGTAMGIFFAVSFVDYQQKCPSFHHTSHHRHAFSVLHWHLLPEVCLLAQCAAIVLHYPFPCRAGCVSRYVAVHAIHSLFLRTFGVLPCAAFPS
jgi:hypothetical protein